MSGDRGILGTLREYGERLRTLERHVSRLPSRLFGGGGGDSGPRIVTELPPIPEGFVEEVYWGSATTIEGGTGDDQVWSCGPSPRTKYRPQENWTTKSGTPV